MPAVFHTGVRYSGSKAVAPPPHGARCTRRCGSRVSTTTKYCPSSPITHPTPPHKYTPYRDRQFRHVTQDQPPFTSYRGAGSGKLHSAHARVAVTVQRDSRSDPPSLRGPMRLSATIATAVSRCSSEFLVVVEG
eukprot:scaffold98882_cov87-Phaeocystis_antarctica.AAC.1